MRIYVYYVQGIGMDKPNFLETFDTFDNKYTGGPNKT